MSRLCLGLIFGFTACWLIGCEQASEQPTTVAEESIAATASSSPANPSTKMVEVAKVPREDSPVVRSADLPAAVSLAAEDWPQFRGANRDGIVRGDTRLARSWPDQGPPVLWETSLGQGYSSPSVMQGKVYLNDYDEVANEWMVRCLSLDDGKELWTYRVKKRIRPNHGITRSAPATDGGLVFSIDPKCELHCLDARDGSLVWKKQLPEIYESLIPAWYSGQCPLLDGDRLIIAVGGKALLVALDRATGEPIWETPNDQEFLLSHSSVMPVEIDGVRQFAYNTLKGMVGVAADSGELLWHFPWKLNTAVATAPLFLGEGKFLLTSGYHAQSVICQVTHDDDGKWAASEVAAFEPPPKGWNSEVHTPVFYRGHIYGVGKVNRGMWTCLDLRGNELWNSGRRATFGMGGYVLADGMFYALDGMTGALRLTDADADQYVELARAELLVGPDVWAPPVIVGGKLLIRDLSKLLCLDIAEQKAQLASATVPAE